MLIRNIGSLLLLKRTNLRANNCNWSNKSKVVATSMGCRYGKVTGPHHFNYLFKEFSSMVDVPPLIKPDVLV